VGLTYDTRDFEPDPASGVMLQAVGRVSTEVLGSAFNYQQFNFSGRGFHNLLGDSGRLILAGRFNYVMQFGDVPFYSAPYREPCFTWSWDISSDGQVPSEVKP
jgi:outer membrane protein assembly factor BamA